MIVPVALYRTAGHPSDAPIVLNATYSKSSYGGYVRVSEIVEVEFPEIAEDPATAIAALAKEEADAIAKHDQMLADIAQRRAKVKA